MRIFLKNTFFISGCLLVLSACTFTLEGNAPKDESAKPYNKTINASSYGSEPIENLCPLDEDLASLRFSTNPVYLMVSLVSFGFYVPQNITWWCGKKEAECTDGDSRPECLEADFGNGG